MRQGNRHERRGGATSKVETFAQLVRAWPQVSFESIAERRGQVVVALFKHSSQCPTLHEGDGLAGCRCSPSISYHLVPTIQ